MNQIPPNFLILNINNSSRLLTIYLHQFEKPGRLNLYKYNRMKTQEIKIKLTRSNISNTLVNRKIYHEKLIERERIKTINETFQNSLINYFLAIRFIFWASTCRFTVHIFTIFIFLGGKYDVISSCLTIDVLSYYLCVSLY